MEDETRRKRWYIVETVYGKDEIVTLRLHGVGFDAWRPVDAVPVKRRATSRRSLCRIIEMRSGLARNESVTTRMVSRFGRYVFLNVTLSDSLRATVLGMEQMGQPLVRCFLCYAGTKQPAPQPDEQIEFLRLAPPKAGKQGIAVVHVGQEVEIMEGPFVGWRGQVKRLDKNGYAIVEITYSGRATPITLEVAHVRPSEMSQAKPPPGRALDKPLSQLA